MKTFKHGGGGGDMIYSLATMKYLGGGELHLNIDHDKKFYKKLLEVQPYIKKVIYYRLQAKEWKKVKVDYDLDKFREQPFHKFTILECHAMAFGIENKIDFTAPWLFNIEKHYVNDIIINDTGKLRWEGVTVDWNHLLGFYERCCFIGLDIEYKNFIRDRKMELGRYYIEDAYDFASAILGSKLYIGNQSTGLAIAEGLKVPRVADLYLGKSKQYPKGEHGYYKLDKELIRRYINE